jgi:glyoxylate reductase
MSKPKVFVTRKIDTEAVQQLQVVADVEIWPHESPPPHDVLVEKFCTVDAVLTLLSDPIDQEVIQASSGQLKVISQMAVGVDNIDVSYATQRGIPVGHTPDALTECCADFTWALMMALARRVAESDNEVHQGIWRPWGPDILLGNDLYQSTLGIIGLGRIGLAVARRAAGFNMRTLYYSRNRKPDDEKQYGLMYVPLDELLQTSDYVSIHTSLNENTRNLFNSRTFSLMQTTAYLINIARGKIVDSTALTQAITQKKIAGAALDVFDPEPIPQDHPLLKFKNVIITPHIASASATARKKIALMAAENIITALKNKPIPYCYNPQIYR